MRRRAPWPSEEGDKAVERPESVRFQGMRVGDFVSTARQFLLDVVILILFETGS